jgi:chromosome segregation ATPase
MTENTVTVSRDEFTSLREEMRSNQGEIRRDIAGLAQKIEYIIDPKKGLYLSVHDNNRRVAFLEKEIDILKAENAKLKEQDARFDKFRIQIVTIVGVIQAAFAAYIALFGG